MCWVWADTPQACRRAPALPSALRPRMWRPPVKAQQKLVKHCKRSISAQQISTTSLMDEPRMASKEGHDTLQYSITTSIVSALGAGSSISSASAVLLFAWRSSHHNGERLHATNRQVSRC